MQGSASGPLGALLLIAPLAAIPVFAIVGVPQFAPVAASPSDDDEFADLGDSTASLEKVPAETPADRQAKSRSTDDLFAPLPDSSPRPDPVASPAEPGRQFADGREVPGRPRNAAQPLPPPDALDNWEIRSGTGPVAVPKVMNEVSAATGKSPRAGGDTSDELQIPSDEPDEGRDAPEGFTPDLLKPEPDRPRGTGRSMEREVVSKSPDQRLDLGKNRPSDLGGSASQTPELPAGMMSEQSGWQAAARRLKELGIRKYRLESQIENQTFTFMCTFTSQDNARIVRKFEAEADTPLEAVQQALEQIDDWRARGSSDKIAALPQED